MFIFSLLKFRFFDVINTSVITITLLNCDYYKIMSKVVNNRLCRLLPKLIQNDQNDFIKGRNIGDNIRKMLDIIDYYANYKNVPGAVMLLDIRKALILCDGLLCLQP